MVLAERRCEPGKRMVSGLKRNLLDRLPGMPEKLFGNPHPEPGLVLLRALLKLFPENRVEFLPRQIQFPGDLWDRVRILKIHLHQLNLSLIHISEPTRR